MKTDPCQLQPITDDDLAQVCAFCHLHLNRNISPAAWKNAFRHTWMADKPNNGFMLTTGGEVVGVFGAIYAEREINGRTERFCNHSSWMVLPEFRHRSLELLTALTGQPGFHMTSLTPNPNVAEICAFLRFRRLDDRVTVIPTPPRLLSTLRSQVETERNRILERLHGESARDYRNHHFFPWLGQVALGRGERFCHVVYKRKRWKRMPAAMVLHVSDPELFLAHHPALGRHLLWRHGVTTLHIPTRFLPESPPGCMQIIDTQPRLLLSDSLGDGAVSFLYTEIVALDLPL